MEEVNSVALSSSGELKLNPLISFVSWKRIGKEDRKGGKEREKGSRNKRIDELRRGESPLDCLDDY